MACAGARSLVEVIAVIVSQQEDVLDRFFEDVDGREEEEDALNEEDEGLDPVVPAQTPCQASTTKRQENRPTQRDSAGC